MRYPKQYPIFKWFKKWWHPGIARYQINARDWAGRWHVYDLDGRLLDWQHRIKYLGDGNWEINKEYANI